MTPIDGLIWCYVIENEVEGEVKVTDFMILKKVKNMVLDKLSKHEAVCQAYLQFYVLTQNNYEDMLKHLMYAAKDDMECDSLSMLTIADNNPHVLSENNFHTSP